MAQYTLKSFQKSKENNVFMKNTMMHKKYVSEIGKKVFSFG